MATRSSNSRPCNSPARGAIGVPGRTSGRRDGFVRPHDRSVPRAIQEFSTMQIRWYGHAAFRLTPENGPSIITDPYLPDLVGYAPIPDTADLVITSSDDDDGHCRADLVPGTPEVLNAMTLVGSKGPKTVQGVEITALEAMEWEHHPDHEVPGQNAMYRMKLDGMQVAHMGDVGNRLTEEQMAFY